MNVFNCDDMLLQAPLCTRAMNGIGTITAGMKLVPFASELTLPTEVPWRMSQIDASYDESFSHDKKPKQPAPATETLHVIAPPCAVRCVLPSIQITYRTPMESSLSARIGRASCRERV